MNDEIIKDEPGVQEIQTDDIHRFVQVFEASARRWELVVYPAMLAFVVLAAYGFFLIYSLSKDIHTLAQGMDPNMSHNLSTMSSSVILMTDSVKTMTDQVEKISGTLEIMVVKMDMLDNLGPMLVNMQGMNDSMNGMNYNMLRMNKVGDAMRHEMGNMGQSMRPMNFMNNFMPW